MTLRDLLGALTAFLNLSALVLVLLGVREIRRGNRDAHQRWMVAGLSCSALFLVAYLTRMGIFGTSRFPGTGLVRTAYFVILGTHTPLAALIVPLVLRVLYLAKKERFAEHRRLARIAWPIWTYVSLTGVLVWVFLVVFPPA